MRGAMTRYVFCFYFSVFRSALIVQFTSGRKSNVAECVAATARISPPAQYVTP
jgi:hypothetical protein